MISSDLMSKRYRNVLNAYFKKIFVGIFDEVNEIVMVNDEETSSMDALTRKNFNL